MRCSGVQPFEYDDPVYPSWDVVQKHFRWTAEVERVGNEYLRRVLDVPGDADIPPVGPITLPRLLPVFILSLHNPLWFSRPQ